MDGIDPVTRIRRVETGRDRYNQPIYDTTESDLPKALYAPRHVIPAVEVGRQPSVVEPTLYWPNLWPDVSADDLLRVRGREYEVNAEAAEWRGHGAGGLVVVLKDSFEGVP
ncbi:hypothetical protein [Leucobacter japonicus]|uniref:hypothetical protein n=1 Tax=Leucobacter japonicus TaxID=1461259 RepID=UPI000A5E405A|nr:hypothetical protein [Leucobacter japonicus]